MTKTATKTGSKGRTAKSMKSMAATRRRKPSESIANGTTSRGEEEIAIDRRRSVDRRASESEVAEADSTAKLERRKKVNRRRQIDPTTCERDYTDQEVEFMNALDEYKRRSGRMFPTCSEVLEVIRSLGYVKLSPNQLVAIKPNDQFCTSAKPMPADLQMSANVVSFAATEGLDSPSGNLA